jgi:hypothetical protein
METYVRIYGIASKTIENLLFNAMDTWQKKSNSCIIFVDFSDFDIPIGTFFTIFAENEDGTGSHDINGELVQVTQQFLKPYDGIPLGHKTVCEIKLDEHSVNLLRSKLPIIDSWYDTNKRCLLGTEITTKIV